MTKAELLDIALSLGIEGLSSRNTKAVIIAAILERQGGAI